MVTNGVSDVGLMAIVNFEQIPHILLMFPLLSLNK